MAKPVTYRARSHASLDRVEISTGWRPPSLCKLNQTSAQNCIANFYQYVKALRHGRCYSGKCADPWSRRSRAGPTEKRTGRGSAILDRAGAEPEEISPHKLADALGSDTIDTLSKQTGVNRDDLLAELSQHLPKPSITSRRMGGCRPSKKYCG